MAAIAAIFALRIAQRRQERESADLVTLLYQSAFTANLSPIASTTNQPLPDPVARYFQHVLADKQAVIRFARFQQSGQLKAAPDARRWLRFTANQVVTPYPRAFLWQARIALLPGVQLQVRDAYLNAMGSSKVSLLSVITLGNDRNRPEVNSAALYRYLAEAVWYPTALLPAAGVLWQTIDDHRALAQLTDGSVSVAVEFRFNAVGEITSLYTENRYGNFNGQYAKYPWEGFFNQYKTYDGIKIPTKAAVGWHLPDGYWQFWQGNIDMAGFEYAQQQD